MYPEGMLFLDIETVSFCPNWDGLDDHWKELWAQKSRNFHHPSLSKSAGEWYTEKSAIFSEFGKIICIGLGYFSGLQFRTTAIAEDTEEKTIGSFFNLVEKHFNQISKHSFCGHNIREFDLPYILRRATILQIKIPAIFQLSNKKPWEIKHIIDTLDLWKFGDLKHYTSLNLLAACLNLPSSKDELDGSQVGEYYWQKNDLSSIVRYCIKDVILTARVYLKINQLGLLEDPQIVGHE